MSLSEGLPGPVSEVQGKSMKIRDFSRYFQNQRLAIGQKFLYFRYIIFMDMETVSVHFYGCTGISGS